MMMQHTCLIGLLLVSAALAALELQRTGWLDRMVQYQKEKLFNEIRELAPININAEIRPKPEGYTDSKHWDYNSVLRLLTLLRGSETAKPVHKALRRMLQPTRRLMMSMKESMHRFPSIKKDDNVFYYDVDYSEEGTLPAPPPVPEDQVVLVVSNPVEARLPSARISVKLLRQILEARAQAARHMRSTTHKIPWVEFVKNRNSTTTGKARDDTKATTKGTTEGTTIPEGGNEGGDKDAALPEGGNEGGDKGATVPEGGNEGGDKDAAVPEGGNEGGDKDAALPEGGKEGGDEGAADPEGGKEGGDEGAADPEGGKEGGDEGAADPEGGKEGGDEGAADPEGGKEGGDEGAADPEGGKKGGDEGAADPEGGKKGGDEGAADPEGGKKGGDEGAADPEGGKKSGDEGAADPKEDNEGGDK